MIDSSLTITGLCEPTDVDCGRGFCAGEDAPCDGYNDCLNLADELGCGELYVTMSCYDINVKFKSSMRAN